MKRLAASAIAAAVLAVPATSSAFETDTQLWAAGYLQFPIASKLRGYLEVQPRWSDAGGEFSQLLVRPAVNWNFGHGITGWVGYAWTPSFQPSYVDEQRPWQQLQHQLERNGVTMVNRLRFEERFIEGAGDVAFRARYMARAFYRPPAWHGFGVAVWDELFVALNTTGRTRQGVDQNRAAVGVQYAVSKALVFEPTYMLQSIYRGPSRPGRAGHTALLMVWITL